ncbi:MAG: non-specific endonuclease, partial [Acidobacteria bacterium]|nr:non-specific endonuclease [Acidobacteriota bacterium]
MPFPPDPISYDPHFLGRGATIPLPKPSAELRSEMHVVGASPVIDYVHYSLVMHAARHTAVFSACNIDGSRIVKGAGGKKTWQLDDRLGNYQLGPEVYNGTAWDKGHLTKREDVVWGTPSEAKSANESTYFYPNAAPQHGNFNRDEWKALEDWIFAWAKEDFYRLTVITGPILKKNDRQLSEGDPDLRGIRDEILDPKHIYIPAAFWKILGFRHKDTGKLTVAAFAMRQTDMWNDLAGHQLLRLKVHQVTVDAIGRWTDLDFGPLHDADVLRVDQERAVFARDAMGQAIWPIIASSEDLVGLAAASGDARERILVER